MRYTRRTSVGTGTGLALALLVALLLGVLVQLSHISSRLAAMYEYAAEADICWQQLEDYYARECYVEREGAEYKWYSREARHE